MECGKGVVQGEGIWKASEAPASKRRRPRSSSLSLTTKSVTDDRNEDAAARNEGGAPAGNAVNGQDVRDAVEVDNVPAATSARRYVFEHRVGGE